MDTITISWTEALGLRGVGKFGDWVDEGRTIQSGASPAMDTAGGQPAQGRLHGLSLPTEAVLRLRGQAGERQVPGADVARVGDGVGPRCASMVLTA
jgi:hypothetical protein